MQKKTFTKWVNSHLSRVSCRITDLYMDLRDGRMLIKLLEVLSGEKLVGLGFYSEKLHISEFSRSPEALTPPRLRSTCSGLRFFCPILVNHLSSPGPGLQSSSSDWFQTVLQV